MIPAQQDQSTVTSEGSRKGRRIDGVRFRPAVTHVDERGQMCEINSDAWEFNRFLTPWVSMYSITPGMAKGWVVHREQDDRNFLAAGRVKWVLYDARVDSPTYQNLQEVVVTQFNRGLLIVPHGVFHAVQNIGADEAVIIDLPSVPYNHENPDKYRLPLNNDIIPYRFGNDVRGW